MATNDRAGGGVTFGEKLKFSSSRKVDFALSDDKKAFEIRFDTALAAGVGTPVFDGLKKTAAPVNSSVYSAVVPIVGKSPRMSIVVNGFGTTEAGTNTKLVLTANDQHSVTHFPAGQDDEAFTVAFPYQGKTGTDLRLTIVLIAERDSAQPEASALIAVNDISADAALTRKPGRKMPRKP